MSSNSSQAKNNINGFVWTMTATSHSSRSQHCLFAVTYARVRSQTSHDFKRFSKMEGKQVFFKAPWRPIKKNLLEKSEPLMIKISHVMFHGSK